MTGLLVSRYLPPSPPSVPIAATQGREALAEPCCGGEAEPFSCPAVLNLMGRC